MFSYLTTVSERYNIQVWSFTDSKKLNVDVLNSIGGNKALESIEEFKFKEDIEWLIQLVQPSNNTEFKKHVKLLCKTHKRLLPNRG